MYARDKGDAVNFRYIQHSHPNMRRWIVVDLDHEDWFFRLEDSGLPMPTYTTCNPNTGHAHAAWLLSDPVSFGIGSRQKPQMYMQAVHRGFTRRLDGDFRYHGLFTQTPFHENWQTYRFSDVAYKLSELDDVLTPLDKKFTVAEKIESGWGRNCTIFDRIRQIAYREVRRIKLRNGQKSELNMLIEFAAFELNSEFAQPLGKNEILSTVKSVVNFAWDKYVGGDSDAQRKRVMIRWDKPGARVGTPWVDSGVSKATWYRQRKAQSTLPDV